MAYAHEVNLRLTDVPGTVSTSSEREGKHRDTQAARICGIREPTNDIVDIHSPTFASGRALQRVLLSSEVEVLPTPALADQQLARAQTLTHSSTTRQCIASTYARAFARVDSPRPGSLARVTLGHSTVSPVQPTTPHSYGLRMTLPYAITVPGTSGAVSAAVRLEVSGFVVGRALVEVLRLQAGGDAGSASDEHLLSLLYSRATAHRL